MRTKTTQIVSFFIAAVIVCGFAGCNSGKKKAAGSQAEEQVQSLYTCTADVLNVRQSPSTTAEVIGILVEGEVCEVIPDSTAAPFKKIKYGDVEAFASADYLEPAGEGAVASQIGYTSDITIDLPETESLITLNDGYDRFYKAPKLTAEEAKEYRTDFIKSKMLPNINNPGEFFTRGKSVYEWDTYRVETVLYVAPDGVTNEYLVTYDWRGNPVDCILIGNIMVYVGDRDAAKISGDLIDVTSFWADETGSGESQSQYRLTPNLKFEKVK